MRSTPDSGENSLDFDTDGVIGKFEEHWGRRTTKALLMLVALGIVATCIGAIWKWLASPLLHLIEAPPWGAGITSFVLSVVGIALGVAAGGWLAAVLMSLQGAWRIRKLVSEGHSLVRQAEQTSRNSAAFLELACVTAQAAIEAHQGLTPKQKSKSIDAIRIAEELVALGRGELGAEDLRRIEELKSRAQHLGLTRARTEDDAVER